MEISAYSEGYRGGVMDGKEVVCSSVTMVCAERTPNSGSEADGCSLDGGKPERSGEQTCVDNCSFTPIIWESLYHSIVGLSCNASCG